MLKFKNEAVGLPLVILAALIVGAMAGISLVSTTSAHSAQVINARVTQTVDNQGVSVNIRTDDPGAMSGGYWSYTRVTVNYDPSLDSNQAVGECTGHCYGEVGPYEAGPDVYNGGTYGNIVPLVVYKSANGRDEELFNNITLADGSYHRWKVVNNKECSDSPTTLDFVWDFCHGSTRLIGHSLDFNMGTSMDSGAEVNAHGVEMMESWHVTNRYIDDSSSSWTSTSNVTCTDGSYNASTDICTTSDDSDYRVRYVTVGNDTGWKTDYNP